MKNNKMDKRQFTLFAKNWLENFLKNKFGNEYNIEVLIPDSNIKKINNDSIRKINNYSLFDFKPDVLGILEKDNEVKLVFLNRTMGPINLQEIGEMNIYSDIADPILSFIVSPKGLPTEVNSLLLDNDIEKSLLYYSNENCIILLRLDDLGVDEKTIFPRDKKEFLL